MRESIEKSTYKAGSLGPAWLRRASQSCNMSGSKDWRRRVVTFLDDEGWIMSNVEYNDKSWISSS